MPTNESACTMWIATLNNPTPEELTQVTQLQGRELVVDQEGGDEGDQAQTPHLHIYLRLTKRARLSTLKKILPRAHWEPAGNRDMAVNYCSKGKVLLRRLAEKGKQSDLEAAIELLQTSGLEAVRRECPKQYILHSKGFESLQYSELDRIAKPVPQVEWYWGPTGTGKTRMAIGDEVNQDNVFILGGPNSRNSALWWDGYIGQKTVVLDDFRPWWCPFSFLLRILDRYPIRVQVKGGFVNFVPEKIIITTPLNIEDTFKDIRSQEDIAQVKRRVHRVVHFCSL